MIRCRPLLGTFVEISIDAIDQPYSEAIEKAFAAIQKVQDLMSFHQAHSELSKMNDRSHLEILTLDPWTVLVLQAARAVYEQSHGLFNCGIGQHLSASGFLPSTPSLPKVSQYGFGGIEDLHFIDSNKIFSKKPLCIDLGGIAKGFAVDMAVDSLQADGIESGCVNAGGDLRVFGNKAQTRHIRHPADPSKLMEIGQIQNASIATSSLYFLRRTKTAGSYLINPLNSSQVEFSESYSVIAKQCLYADALTKVLAISNHVNHPCFNYFSAKAVRIPA